jgi:hypothetical protein
MRPVLILALAACVVGSPALSQSVEVAPLSAPDIFSGGSRETGLPETLWKGSSAEMARRVIPQLGAKPLTPAARALALRLLTTGANAPDGAGEDRLLAAARGRALLGLGDAGAANAAVERIPNLGAEPVLAEAAAEAALIAGADDRACRIENSLATGRGDAYWLRLRAYCQAAAGQPDAAQLSLTLASEAARDPVFTRLITALMFGGDAGPGSARNGLDLALSRKLNLAPLADGAPPAIAALLAPPPLALPPPPELMQSDPMRAARQFVRAGDLDQARMIRRAFTSETLPGGRAVELELLDAAIAVAAGEVSGPFASALVTRGAAEGAKSPAQAAAVLMSALGAPLDGDARAALAGFDLGKSGSPARLAALDLAAEMGLKGEVGLAALALCLDAGAAGPSAADRAAIIRALRKVGLNADAQSFALEGLLALSPK